MIIIEIMVIATASTETTETQAMAMIETNIILIEVAIKVVLTIIMETNVSMIITDKTVMTMEVSVEIGVKEDSKNSKEEAISKEAMTANDEAKEETLGLIIEEIPGMIIDENPEETSSIPPTLEEISGKASMLEVISRIVQEMASAKIEDSNGASMAVIEEASETVSAAKEGSLAVPEAASRTGIVHRFDLRPRRRPVAHMTMMVSDLHSLFYSHLPTITGLHPILPTEKLHPSWAAKMAQKNRQTKIDFSGKSGNNKRIKF